ncbi:MAG: guanylate kinase [Verrucomicrobiota bacterium]|jgi:guanylate kinase|nr:guanylate kinase [Verrucomicrobiota bacterium]MDP6250585.1 guanylate kinase [Verrucomicrobiota bacterium]MDP7176977.1 guanylate kinase [Verrucomicrobiota bacterium]MDP7291192.1 guanylate kinase [Verrucomicrobiota bacterium]MDP7440289.1 guanylate kinase [Verrucomicrobiota bacterium]|tara:strand:+ start:2388 stop:3014 length:627 start_codon:yes stop_codon:yes gene_type:complete
MSSAVSSAPLLVVVSAPSGAGKSTLCDNVRAALPSASRAVTCTTRKPRDGELDGVDYYFLDEEEFLARVEGGEFLENAVVHGNYYGVLKSELRAKLAEGSDVLLNIDVQGAATIRERAATDPVLSRSLITVFLCPPSLGELEQRLRGRGTDSEEAIARRLAIAKDEMDQAEKFDHSLTSQTREVDVDRLLGIIENVRLAKREAIPTHE